MRSKRAPLVGCLACKRRSTCLCARGKGGSWQNRKGFPLASLATVTLFSDPHLRVDSVGVRVLHRQPLTYGLSLGASLL